MEFCRILILYKGATLAIRRPKWLVGRSNMPTNSACAPANHATYYRCILSNRPHSLQKVDHLAVISPFQRGQEICGQGQSADRWYFVISGAARRCVFRPDGRRQIVDLLLSGDFFGFTAAEEYDFSAEAIGKETVVAAYPRRRIEVAAESDSDLARQIYRTALESISRIQSQLLIVGRITAPEKVGSFILEMAARLSRGRSDTVALPITRYDIAEYLAVSVETVSRSLSDLKRRGLIQMSGTREVKIIDRDALVDRKRSAMSRVTSLDRQRQDRNSPPRPDSSRALRYG
jgi:CRP/FNR family nitrogen fixation transcriptional regulator